MTIDISVFSAYYWEVPFLKVVSNLMYYKIWLRKNDFGSETRFLGHFETFKRDFLSFYSKKCPIGSSSSQSTSIGLKRVAHLQGLPIHRLKTGLRKKVSILVYLNSCQQIMWICFIIYCFKSHSNMFFSFRTKRLVSVSRFQGSKINQKVVFQKLLCAQK